MRKLPEEGTPEFDEIKEWFKCGKDYLIIAKYNVSQSTIRHTFAGLKRYPLDPQEQPLEDLEAQVLGLLKKQSCSVGTLSRLINPPLGVSRETVIKLVDSLRAKHYQVELDEATKEVSVPDIPTKEFEPTQFQYYRKVYKIGFASDTHIGSKYSQMSLLYDAYSIFDDNKVDFIIHPGDLFDGNGMYRGHDQEVFLHGAKEQREYARDNYPKSRRGIKTYVIGGQHDRSFYKHQGYDILEHLCEERDDLVYRGFYKATYQIKDVIIEAQHPGGGVSYARSYRPQKIVENMVGSLIYVEGVPIPHIVAFGHWHIPLHLPLYMGVDVIACPCFQRQTPYLEQLGLMPVVGCAIATITLDEVGKLSSTKVEFVNMNHRIIEKDY
jgi:predicted phosphodiesterase/biotin operon repressor